MATTARELTAFEVIDGLMDRCVELVLEKNAGARLTEAQFAATVSNTFNAAFEAFMVNIDANQPEKAAGFRAALARQIADEN
jgi:hypothetical protein